MLKMVDLEWPVLTSALAVSLTTEANLRRSGELARSSARGDGGGVGVLECRPSEERRT